MFLFYGVEIRAFTGVIYLSGVKTFQWVEVQKIGGSTLQGVGIEGSTFQGVGIEGSTFQGVGIQYTEQSKGIPEHFTNGRNFPKNI